MQGDLADADDKPQEKLATQTVPGVTSIRIYDAGAVNCPLRVSTFWSSGSTPIELCILRAKLSPGLKYDNIPSEQIDQG